MWQKVQWFSTAALYALLLNYRVRLYPFIILSGQQGNIWDAERGRGQSDSENWVAGKKPRSWHPFASSQEEYALHANNVTHFDVLLSKWIIGKRAALSTCEASLLIIDNCAVGLSGKISGLCNHCVHIRKTGSCQSLIKKNNGLSRAVKKSSVSSAFLSNCMSVSARSYPWPHGYCWD